MYRLLVPLVFLTITASACGPESTEVAAGASGDDVTTTTEGPDVAPPGDGPDESPDELGLPVGGPYPIATLSITVTHPDHDDITYEVSCLGDTASVIAGIGESGVNEIDACTALGTDEVRARLVDGVPGDQICTEQYGGPDLARIVGTYDGVDGITVDTTIDRSNGCGINDWDAILEGLLPPAKGV